MSTEIRYSVVVPVYNSSHSLPLLTVKISEVFKNIKENFEIIYVDDCSTDNSWELLKSLKKSHPDIQLFRLSKNFGQYASTLCGVNQAKGEFVITIDDDLQYEPGDILRMLEEMQKQNDAVVYAHPLKKQQPLWLRLATQFTTIVSGKYFLKEYRKKEPFSSFRIISKSLLHNRFPMTEINTNIDTYIYWAASARKIGFTDVHHFKRKFGRSGTSFFAKVIQWSNFFFLWWDSPLRFVASFAWILTMVTLGLVTLNIFSVVKNHLPFIIFSILLTTVFLFSASILAVYLAKIYQHLLGKPFYVIAEKL